MNKKVYKYLYLVSILMICVFIILIIVDHSNYDPITTSAPFYADILLRAVEFVFLAFVFACVAYYLSEEILIALDLYKLIGCYNSLLTFSIELFLNNVIVKCAKEVNIGGNNEIFKGIYSFIWEHF